MPLIQYPEEVIRTWRTGRLGALYMNSFTVSRTDPGESSQLARITRILDSRPFEEKRALYLEIQEQIRVNCRSEDYERAALLEDMKQHLLQHIFN